MPERPPIVQRNQEVPMLQKLKVTPTHRQPYAPRRRRQRNGLCAAALRAFTAAKLYQRGEFKSLVAGANGCGSNPRYVKAALILKRTNNTVLVNDVLLGDRPLLAAAKAAERLAVDRSLSRGFELRPCPIRGADRQRGSIQQRRCTSVVRGGRHVSSHL
jgi:hypothetical protein